MYVPLGNCWCDLKGGRGPESSEGSFTSVCGSWAGKSQTSGDWNSWGSSSISLDLSVVFPHGLSSMAALRVPRLLAWWLELQCLVL